MHVIQLARDQPAVVAPFGQPIPRGAAYARQVSGQTSHLIDPHLPGLPTLIRSYAWRRITVAGGYAPVTGPSGSSPGSARVPGVHPGLR